MQVIFCLWSSELHINLCELQHCPWQCLINVSEMSKNMIKEFYPIRDYFIGHFTNEEAGVWRG